MTATLNLATLILVAVPLFWDVPRGIAFGIVSFTMLTVVANQYYSLQGLERRVKELEFDYTEFQIISQEFEILHGKPGLVMNDINPWIDRYQELVKRTENHETKDYRRGNE